MEKKYVYLLVLASLIIIGAFGISMIVTNRNVTRTTIEKPEPPVTPPIEKPADLSFEKPDEKTIETPREDPDEPQAKEKGPRELYSIKLGDVVSIEYISDHGKLNIIKSGSQWSVNGDKYSRIDQNKVSSAINKLLIINSMETVSYSDTDREQWGISDSSKKILIKTTDGSLHLLLGSLNKERTGYYLQIQGTNEIYLIKNTIGESLQLELDYLRDRNLALFNSSDIETMVIKNEKEIRIIPYKRSDIFTADKFSYMLEAPYNAYIPVSNNDFSTFLNSMDQTIQIIDFIDEGDPEEYGINEESWSLSIIEKNGRTSKLLLGSDVGSSKVYGKLSGEKQIFTVSRKDLPFLTVKPFDLVEKLPHLISMDTIDTFMIINDELAVLGAFDRRGDGDQYSINGIETEKKTFISLYEKIQELTLTGEVETTINTEKPELIISYKLYDGGSLWTHLNFYSYDEDYFAVSRNEEAPLFLVGKTQIRKMLENVTLTVDTIMGF